MFHPWAKEAPLYFIQFQQEINEKFQEMSNQISANIAHEIQQLRTQMKLTDVRILNEQARTYNRSCLRALSEHVLHDSAFEFRILAKDRPGLGEGVPGNFQSLESPPSRPIGSTPPDHFPKNKHDLNTLTHGQINYLAKFYNLDFGITQDMALNQRRARFSYFLAHSWNSIAE